MGEYLPEGSELAVKVYKTSILVFKDRARYVEGEFRFRRGYCKSNPRKMVAMWAEKEMRNLRRMRNANLPCPIPVEVRQNVLVMEYVGHDGVAAPRLKDAEVASYEWPALYRMLVRIVRTMYQVCHLVHGDLSEYNILYHRHELQVIDVSQSVEHDHPQALEFLKRDLVNVNDFFGRMSVPVVGVKALFDFIRLEIPGEPSTKPATTLSDAEEEELEKLLLNAALVPDDEPTAEEMVDEAVFLNTWTPSHLNQVENLCDIEKDLKRRAAGGENLYDRLLGTVGTTPGDEETDGDGEAEEEEAEDEEAEGEGAEEGEEEGAKNNGRKPADMDKAAWKALVKAERAEKRQSKMPKFEKKKRTRNKH
jgi:RIO kinase 1